MLAAKISKYSKAQGLRHFLETLIDHCCYWLLSKYSATSAGSDAMVRQNNNSGRGHLGSQEVI